MHAHTLTFFVTLHSKKVCTGLSVMITEIEKKLY